MSRVIKELSIQSETVILDGEIIFSSEEKELGGFLKDLYKHTGINYGKFFKMDYLSKLGFLSSELLLKDVEEIKPETDEVALIFANASSSLNTDIKYQKSMEEIPSPAVFVYTLPNIVIGEISIRNKFYGEHIFLVQAKYDKNILLKYAESLFETTATKYALVGLLELSPTENYNVQLMLCAKK